MPSRGANRTPSLFPSELPAADLVPKVSPNSKTQTQARPESEYHYALPPSITTHIPALLSNRFQRAIALRQRRNELSELASGDPAGTLPPLKSGPSGQGDGQATSSAMAAGLGRSQSPQTEGDSKTQGKTDNNMIDSLDSAKYRPFPLSDGSSFSPNRIGRRRFQNLDPLTKAKYLAYQPPAPPCAKQINDSERRARSWEVAERKATNEWVSSVLKRWERRKQGVLVCTGEEGKAGTLGAKKAVDRMKGKIERAIAARESELQFLVEGQSNSIDAIRLKEHLDRKHGKIRLGKIYTDKDRIRIEELLS
ncbi:uncharacterized protein BJ171DRAFT_626365 [Polychytrium aggregatum]|uniref:uncharacterized protein n=1 Tax=Polychytrium aggregatum TaxID=110093 RepID=UPI0022FEA5EA|nr:uncharacterized protein BJ171DRAFT_626365 [Polychytrium aggregatum]KAI9202693.1 hypothetical protein BJ171DRAFT_626365 [Polychytrium aggregatum]